LSFEAVFCISEGFHWFNMVHVVFWAVNEFLYEKKNNPDFPAIVVVRI
jgi:hypothetical protein